MQQLYLWLNLGSFIVPFLFSFHPKLRFYKKWKSLAIGIAVMMAIFVPWDIVFTSQEVWGFNPDYLTGIYFLGLPIEEWLFFTCIPYACIFTHYALVQLLPNIKLKDTTVTIIYCLLLTTLIVLLWYHYDKWYTLVNFVYAILILGVLYQFQRKLFSTFFLTYLVILIPFFLMNGILTGSGLEEPVVWYNNSENLSIRLGTIPIEDTIYNLGMLLTVLGVTEYFEKRKDWAQSANS